MTNWGLFCRYRSTRSPFAAAACRPDSVTTPVRRYSSLRNFKLDSAYPVVEGYEDVAGNDAVAGGVRLNFSDRVGTTALDVTSTFSPGDGLRSWV